MKIVVRPWESGIQPCISCHYLMVLQLLCRHYKLSSPTLTKPTLYIFTPCTHTHTHTLTSSHTHSDGRGLCLLYAAPDALPSCVRGQLPGPAGTPSPEPSKKTTASFHHHHTFTPSHPHTFTEWVPLSSYLVTQSHGTGKLLLGLCQLSLIANRSCHTSQLTPQTTKGIVCTL